MSRALVLGGASCLWDDLRALGPWDGLVIATNDAGVTYPHRIDHWATIHGEKLAGWTAERTGNADFSTWTHPGKPGFADRYLGGWTSGSSGMFAVGVALELGCDTVVLCGVPMTETPHFFDAEPWRCADTHWPIWLKREAVMRGRVFSMSGRTRDLLGGPPWMKEAA